MNNFIVFHIVLTTGLYSQTFEVKPLPKVLNETSGLESLNGYYLTHNDSGNPSSLFGIDLDGNILFERKYSELKNVDWEDLTRDSQFLYVADTGNNFDAREDLRILKFDLHTLHYVGTINFRYSVQASFEINTITEFDAEAIINIENNLVLFSKNRRFKNTQLYKIPKELGSYGLEKFGEIDSELIITGGDFSPELELLILTGTKDFKEYYIQLYEGFTLTTLEYKRKRTTLIPFDSLQVEAVKIIDHRNFLVTSESENDSKLPKLIKISF